MERSSLHPRRLENRALGRASIGDLLSNLEPEEFDVLWDLTDKNLTLAQIAQRNGISVNQINTIRQSLARKATAYLSTD
jgi:hypothetical protein